MNTIKHLQSKYIYTLFLVVTVLHLTSAQNILNSSQSGYKQEISRAFNMLEQNPDLGYQILDSIVDICYAKNDTNLTVSCLIGLSDIERFRGNYNQAFEHLWDAQLLIQTQKNNWDIPKIHRNIGILYGIYNKDSLAISQMQLSLKHIKSFPYNKRKTSSETKSTYFAIASIYKNKKQYNKALLYLDSCEIVDTTGTLTYIENDKGYINLKLGNLESAENSLHRARKNLIKSSSRYLAVNSLYLGDLKLAQGYPDSALRYYTKSLNVINNQQTYKEFKPEVLQKQSKLYQAKNKHFKAYNLLFQSKTIADSLFNANNASNGRLFTIKNKYKEQLIRQQQLVQDQKLLIEQKNKEKIRLKLTLIIITILALGAVLFIRMKMKLRQLTLQQAMEHDKNQAVLETKGKELTSYALQMVQKDEAIHALLENIKENAPGDFAKLRQKYTKQSEHLWEEFNLRFIELNSNFYRTLSEKHPNLSQTEQKHCALIKLNFDSPQMAQILNISLQSVHTSRYRIRKKIGLEHQESLGDYISKL